MEYYDTIIIGAGIAGCGLVHNLKKINYRGKILIIDKKEIGSHEGYGYKMVFEHERQRYNLPCSHKYKGVHLGSYDKLYAYAKAKFCFLNYKKTCQFLLKKIKTDITFRKEEAIGLKKDRLKTNLREYHFDYLVDCSGYKNFLRKKLNFPMSSAYWIGKTRILEGKTSLESENYYSFFGDGGFYEDIYIMGNRILHGHWQYTNKIDFNKLIIPERTGGKKYLSNLNCIHEQKVVIPCSPLYPLVHKNLAWLGDSFGNALTHSATGIYKSLEASEILAHSIKKNNLPEYEKIWKRKNEKSYLHYLAFRLFRFRNATLTEKSSKIKNFPKMSEVLKILKKHPQIFIKRYQHAQISKTPQEIKNYFNFQEKLIMLKHKLYLKIKYSRKKASI